MAQPAKDFKKGLERTKIDGTGLNIAIVSARWNAPIIAALVSGCESAVKATGARVVQHITVPGSYELPFAAKSLIINSQKSGSTRIDAVVCIGTLIKGETMHFEYICEAVTQGITRVGLDTGVPVMFGVLTCLSDHQAELRAGLKPGGHNHGEDWGTGAVEMAKLKFIPSKL